ncbi:MULTISPECIES: glutamate racemase [Ramlibacter]|uniref:Glutamate racemase n=1 Tax=Ramlibacter pinisoli TaxID=2682844 RepID=A0A6N8IZ44_9BURK|nr:MULTISPECIES: glutamate racemase [Ramlibacter]MBA2961909.1 glutamate racemase [Ramlibacter sp. CGMCC 1.13660]MVQ31852.1 glutamate racemase [Ramlibacter pinisoli]
MESRKPIGVFDSGVGGLSILRALRSELPQEDVVYFSDAGHGPYGERADAFVAERSRAIARQLLDEHRVKALVVACNTATAAAVHLLRAQHDHIPTVGVEPALKPAADLSRTGRIAVFATRSTLSSARFRSLHESLRGRADFVLQPCDGLAAAIETQDHEEVRSLCRLYARSAGEFGNGPDQIDTLVLGCTHYAFACRELEDEVGQGVRILETGAPVARQTRRLLEARRILNDAGRGQVELVTTGAEHALRQAAQLWL